MSELEAQSLLLEYSVLLHEYGEAMWDRVDLWISISSGLIVMAYFAPDKLTRPLTLLILSLYSFLTVFMVSNFLADFDNLDQVSEQATALAVNYALPFQSDPRIFDIVSAVALGLFAIGLCFGTIWYIWHVSSKTSEPDIVDDDT